MLNKTKVFPFLLVFGLFLTENGSAFQEKKIPKPKPIKSSKSVEIDSTKQHQNRLEIPEVLIFGKDRSIRVPTTKRTELESNAILPLDLDINRGQKSEPSSIDEDQIPDKVLTSLNHSSQVELRYGTYNSPFLSANHWHQFNKTSFDIEGMFEKSDGQYRNSQFENWMISFSAVYEFNFRNKIYAGGSFRSFDYGLWASSVDHKREWNQSQFRVGYNGTINESTQYELRFSQVKSPIESDIDQLPDSLSQINNREKNREISAKLIRIWNNMEISFQAVTYTNKLDANINRIISIPNLGYINSISKLNINVARQISQNGFIRAGLDYQFYDLDSLGISDNRFNPVFEFTWNASSKVKFSGFYKSFWRLTTRQQLLEINPASDLQLTDSPIEDIKSSAGVGLQWQMNPLSSLSLSYNYQDIENLQAWMVPDNSDPFTLFRIRTFPKAHLSLFKLEFAYGNLAPYRIRSTILISGSSIDDFGNTLPADPAERKIPYLEDVKFPVEFEYRLNTNVIASVTGDYLSSRVFSLSQPVLGKSFLRLNARINYKKDKFELYILSTNILDQKYQIWQNYMENGIQIFSGLKVIF